MGAPCIETRKVFSENIQTHTCKFSSVLSQLSYKLRFFFKSCRSCNSSSCLIGIYNYYKLHVWTFLDKNIYKMLFFKIFNFSKIGQYLAFGWLLSLLTINVYRPHISFENIFISSIRWKNNFLLTKITLFWAKFNNFRFLTPPTWPKVHEGVFQSRSSLNDFFIIPAKEFLCQFSTISVGPILRSLLFEPTFYKCTMTRTLGPLPLAGRSRCEKSTAT